VVAEPSSSSSSPFSASSENSNDEDAIMVMSLSLRQFYFYTWTAACLLGMILIAIIFVAQRISDEVLADQQQQDHGPANVHSAKLKGSSSDYGGEDASLGMTKNSAMVMCFVYAGLAWMMSNGLVLNPRLKTKK
jgi:hypothetical protein